MKINLLKKHAKSFYWASFFLSSNTLDKCSSLYNFCRTLDDIVDDDNNLSVKKGIFSKFKKDFENKNLDNQIIKDMWSLIDSEGISYQIVIDLFDGVETDLKEKVVINSKKDLLVYSYRVAGTVGLMMAKILNVNETRALKGAIDLGIAMQLTNIARDVIEDQKMNRQYIKPDFENIEATIKLADMFYESSFSSIKKIPFKYRFAIIVARRVYRQIGRKIIQKKSMETYEKSGKIYVNNFEKVYQTILSIFDLLFLFLKDVESHQRIEEYEIIRQEVDLDERI